MFESQIRDLLNAIINRTIESQSSPPDHLGALGSRPTGYLIVIARDECREFGDNGEDSRGQPFREARSIDVREYAREASFGGGEPLDWNQHGEAHSALL